MELLLLLTAFLASLTGAGQADRAVRQVQGVAVVHAAQAVQQAALPVRRAAPAVAVPALRPEKTTWPEVVRATPAMLRLPFERRLE